MNLRRKIALSNMIMVVFPVALSLFLWAAYIFFHQGRFIKPKNSMVGKSSEILDLYDTEVAKIHWSDLAQAGKIEVTDTDSIPPSSLETLRELSEAGFRFSVSKGGATFFSNLSKKDLPLTSLFLRPSINIEENRVVIRDIVTQDSTAYAVVAVYDESVSDSGVRSSLIPIYLVSPKALLSFLSVVALAIVALNFLLTNYLARAATLERQVQNLSEMAKGMNAEVVATVGGERLVPETLGVAQKSNTDGEIRAGELKILPAARSVSVKGKAVNLKNKEFELLLFLAENSGIVFSKETLYERVWGENLAGDISTVTVHIKRIREKIEENSAEPRYIQTVWGAGYKFAP